MKLTGAALTALACAIVLSGCVTAVTYPESRAGDEEIERQRILDLTWQSLGLTGVERPASDLIPLTEGEVWDIVYFECAAQTVGNASLGFSFSSDIGYQLELGGTLDDATALALYTCVASMPLAPYGQVNVHSPEQIDYLYDYHQSWLIPCLENRDLHIVNVPTRSEFAAGGGQWDPYNSMAGDDYLAAVEAQEHCGLSPAQQLLLDAIAPDAE